MSSMHCKEASDHKTQVSYYKCEQCGKEGYIAITGLFDNESTISGIEKCPEGGVHDLKKIDVITP